MDYVAMSYIGDGTWYKGVPQEDHNACEGNITRAKYIRPFLFIKEKLHVWFELDENDMEYKITLRNGFENFREYACINKNLKQLKHTDLITFVDGIEVDLFLDQNEEFTGIEFVNCV